MKIEKMYTCETCFWWVHKEGVIGDCHGGPPLASMGKSFWPPTHNNMWCGQHKLDRQKVNAIAAIDTKEIEPS